MECANCPVKPIVDAFIAADSLSAFSSRQSHPLAPLVKPLAESLSAICLACSRSSDDDNLSRHGKTFVSFDSESEPSRSSSASSAADFIYSRRSPDYNPPAYGVFDYGFDQRTDASEPDAQNSDISSTTSLPVYVEEALKRQFVNLKSLSPLDLCLVAHVLQGKSLASFASMSWLTRLPYDPATMRPIPITRQAAHSRFRSICRRIPVLAVLSPSAANSFSDPAEFDASQTPESVSQKSAPPDFSKRRICARAASDQSSPVLQHIRSRSSRRSQNRLDLPSQMTLFNADDIA